ncbi:MAG: hypothetical protein HY053_08985 [Proteobacteria bacterium]|nr:hypothetical protein [Pseudomonadota bacterium]
MKKPCFAQNLNGMTSLKHFSGSSEARPLQRRELHALSEEMQGLLATLSSLVEQIEPYAGPAAILLAKKKLKGQVARLRDATSLMGTILETNSSEILRYVKKRAG